MDQETLRWVHLWSTENFPGGATALARRVFLSLLWKPRMGLTEVYGSYGIATEQQELVGGWANPSEKYEFVSWDDEIPNIWKNKIHVPNHQPNNMLWL